MSGDSQKIEQATNNLYEVINGYVTPKTISARNREKGWKYGYDKELDLVVISKTGEIGDIYLINGLKIALPKKAEKVHSRSDKKSEQYWERTPVPKELDRIKSIFQWNTMPKDFKNKWIDYIEQEFEYRENGYWFKNNGIDTWIPGSHYMYLQWSAIDIGYPDYREANRILFIFWEAVIADPRAFGMIYVKIRRSGFSFMASSESVSAATLAKNAKVGIVSKTGNDAKDMFVNKVVPINNKYPFFFKPIMDGMDKPKTELSYRVPATKITKKNMYDVDDTIIEGLDSTIDWQNTGDNSYDGQKLLRLIEDEASKWLKPNNILNHWRVAKTCLRLGSKIVGKCMMGSTVNALSKGGKEFKELYYSSNPLERNSNGQTRSGLYSLFIPMEWNFEGYIDRYGMPVFRRPEVPVLGIDNEMIDSGAIDFWEGEVAGLKNDPDALNEFYRQYPRTEAHAFRDESKSTLFNLTKIYEQVDYNDSVTMQQYVTRGSFSWKDGIKDSKVIWTPDNRGRFYVSWIPKKELQNRVSVRNGNKYPGNEHIGVFGCDPYDISGTVDGRSSNGSLHGLTLFNMDDAPSNQFFLEYIARPQTAEVFFEDVLMACVFYGMPILAENNKARLLYHFKNRGYRGYSMNRPDKHLNQLSKTEIEIGGIPNSSEDIKQAHASAIESYIEKYIGYDTTGGYRSSDAIGNMPFNRTLEDWAKFDISDRTRHDASISSGLAIMASQKHLYKPIKKDSKISIKFARYNNDGFRSEIHR